MSVINLQLAASTVLNASVRPGDIAYFIPASTQVGGFTVNLNSDEPVQIGQILEITTTQIDGDDVNNMATLTLVCEITDNGSQPSEGDFILFSKNRAVNEASIVGYYGKFRFKNNSRSKAELFVASCDVNMSSN